MIFRAPKPELIGYRNELLSVKILLQITFLEDVFSHNYFISSFTK